MRCQRPRRLVPGDTIAVLSPSWGGPSLFPAVYERGLEVLRRWGLRVREYPTTRLAAETLARDPRARARDVQAAFADPQVRGIIASIGGEDSIRLLPHLDASRWAEDPKILMGFSDTTTLLVHGVRHGLGTFYGPSIMAGFAQMDALPGFEAHVHDLLFAPRVPYEYAPFTHFCHGYPDWATAPGAVNPLHPNGGWRVLQGRGTVRGELLGGCLEVLEWLKGTSYFPAPGDFAGAIVFLETSEEKPSVDEVRRRLRSYGVSGLFAHAAALVFGRARDYTDEENAALDRMLVEVIGGEFEAPTLPLVTGLDFGHTDPQWVLPLGVRAELDLDAERLRLVEPWLE